jgi:type II secretory pathway pseudopilin PulG
VVIAIVAFTSIGLTAAAEGRLDAAVSAHEQAQAEAEAEQEREEEAQDPVEVPVDTPPAPPPASAGGHQIEWTDTTSLGYSITSTVTWGSVVRGTEGTPHPSSSGFTLGSGCGFEPTKDAYVAGVWTVTNSTETYALALQSQMSVQGRLSTPGVSVALEWNTSSGPNCGFSTLPYAASVESNSDIESGQSIRSPIFIIIKNYYSPTYPEGDVGDLANIKVTQGFLGGVNAPLG